MKTLVLIVLALLLSFGTNAQLSLQGPSPLSNLDRNMEYIQYKPAPVIEKEHPTYYGATAVLFSTFLINHFIGKNDENQGSFKNTARKTGTVYVAGVTLTIGICILESRKERRDKLYDVQEQEKRWNACN